MPKLRRLATAVFRDGVPTCTLDDIRAMLKSDSDMVQFDHNADSHFKSGDMVIIDQQKQATVVGLIGDGNVLVTYDNEMHLTDDQAAAAAASSTDMQSNGQEDLRARTSASSKGTPVAVTRVRRRQTVSFYQTWLLPTSISNMIVDATEQFDVLERSALYPSLRMVTQVLTWQGKKLISMSLVVVLLSLSALAFRTEMVYEADQKESEGDNQHEFEESLAWLAISSMRNLDNVIMLCVMFVVFVLNAKWFAFVRSLLRVLGRLSMQRRAPELWAFYQEDSQMQQALENLAPKSSDWPDFAKFAKIPGSLKGPMASLPDVHKLQAQLGKIKGLAQFKLPDLTHPSNQATPATEQKV